MLRSVTSDTIGTVTILPEETSYPEQCDGSALATTPLGPGEHVESAAQRGRSGRGSSSIVPAVT